MSGRKPDCYDDPLPIELKLKLLEAELSRLESDFEWIRGRRRKLIEETRYYRSLLSRLRRKKHLRRVK